MSSRSTRSSHAAASQPLHVGQTGKTILAVLPDDQADKVLDAAERDGIDRSRIGSQIARLQAAVAKASAAAVLQEAASLPAALGAPSPIAATGGGR